MEVVWVVTMHTLIITFVLMRVKLYSDIQGQECNLRKNINPLTFLLCIIIPFKIHRNIKMLPYPDITKVLCHFVLAQQLIIFKVFFNMPYISFFMNALSVIVVNRLFFSLKLKYISTYLHMTRPRLNIQMIFHDQNIIQNASAKYACSKNT